MAFRQPTRIRIHERKRVKEGPRAVCRCLHMRHLRNRHDLQLYKNLIRPMSLSVCLAGLIHFTNLLPHRPHPTASSTLSCVVPLLQGPRSRQRTTHTTEVINSQSCISLIILHSRVRCNAVTRRTCTRRAHSKDTGVPQ